MGEAHPLPASDSPHNVAPEDPVQVISLRAVGPPIGFSYYLNKPLGLKAGWGLAGRAAGGGVSSRHFLGQFAPGCRLSRAKPPGPEGRSRCFGFEGGKKVFLIAAFIWPGAGQGASYARVV